MVGEKRALPRDVLYRIALKAALASLVSCTISSIVAASVMSLNGAPMNMAALLVAVILPLLMTPPVIVVLLLNHERLRMANSELKKLAYTDTMLACMNRRGFTSSLDIALQYASPHRPCALLVIDADNFKRVNDKFGHTTGDQALRMIVGAIKSVIRSADILGRVGGEEFCVFLPSTGHDQVQYIAERICQAVRRIDFRPEGEAYSLSVSVGGAVATAATTFERLFPEADARLYTAKEKGRDQVHMFPRPLERSTA